MSAVATTSNPEFPWESPIPSGDFWATIPNNLARHFYQTLTTEELEKTTLDASLPEIEKLKALDEILVSHVADEKAKLDGTPLSSPEAKRYRSLLLLQANAKQYYGAHAEAEKVQRDLIEISTGQATITGLQGGLALSLKEQGKYSEAEEYAKVSLKDIQGHEMLGTHSPQALGSMRMLMEIYAGQGKFVEAWKIYEEGVVVVDEMGKGKFGKYQGEEKEALEEMKVLVERKEKGSDKK